MKTPPEGKLRYYAESDVLHYLIAEGEEFVSREVAPGVTLELDEDGRMIGIEILDAARFMKNFVLEQFGGQPAATVNEPHSRYGKKR
ncbi:MAG: DUF2283 domain-containing protein [Verrucomicrobia bacterium]|nr:DUF2283 domain-containing protein [Verrucomicrobiota bacterium]